MYFIGQKVCLWQEAVTSRKVTVLKEIIVTIIEMKTGALGDISGEPVSSTSLRAIGDDGKVYEKHWDFWPESQTECFSGVWSMRYDGEGDDKCWTPKEAVHAYTTLNIANERYLSTKKLVRQDRNGHSILPKGDVTYCERHDRYSHLHTECFDCRVDKRLKSA